MTERVAPSLRASRLRSWLLADSPASSFHARCQRMYLGWCAFKANPIAMAGLVIVLMLVLAAAVAPLITGGDGIEQNLAQRLLPPSAAPPSKRRRDTRFRQKLFQ
jgi:peptide/nickel transport system permease protein